MLSNFGLRIAAGLLFQISLIHTMSAMSASDNKPLPVKMMVSFNDPNLFRQQCTYNLWRNSNKTKPLNTFTEILLQNYNYGLWTLSSINFTTTIAPSNTFFEKCSVNIIIFADEVYSSTVQIFGILSQSEYTHRNHLHNIFIFVVLNKIVLPMLSVQVGSAIFIHSIPKDSTRFPTAYLCSWCLKIIKNIPNNISITDINYKFVRDNTNDGDMKRASLITSYSLKPLELGIRQKCPWEPAYQRDRANNCNQLEAMLDAIEEGFNATSSTVGPNYYTKLGSSTFEGYIEPTVIYITHQRSLVNHYQLWGVSRSYIIHCQRQDFEISIALDIWTSAFDYKIYILLIIVSITLLLLIRSISVLTLFGLLIGQSVVLSVRKFEILLMVTSLLVTVILASSYQNYITSMLVVPSDYVPISNLSQWIKRDGKLVIARSGKNKQQENFTTLLSKEAFYNQNISDKFESSVIWFPINHDFNETYVYADLNANTTKAFLLRFSEEERKDFISGLDINSDCTPRQIKEPFETRPLAYRVTAWAQADILKRISQFHEHGFASIWKEREIYTKANSQAVKWRNSEFVSRKKIQSLRLNFISLRNLVPLFFVWGVLAMITVACFIGEVLRISYGWDVKNTMQRCLIIYEILRYFIHAVCAIFAIRKRPKKMSKIIIVSSYEK